MRRALWVLLALPGSALVVGCVNESPSAPASAPKAPSVVVSVPVTRPVIEYEEFTGMTQAMRSIEVRAHVSGYLTDRAMFNEGAEVKQGDLIFEIDPRPFQAELAQAEANLLQAEAKAQRMTLDLDRNEKLVFRRIVSQEDYDKTRGDKMEAEAAVGSAKAARDRAKLNLEYTQIRAQTGGRISKRMIDPWNMVKADETPLTTIVSQDPMYAYFDVDEATALRLRRLVREGKLKTLGESSLPVDLPLLVATTLSLMDSPQGQGVFLAASALYSGRSLPVHLGLADEEGFPHAGTVDFVDNQLDGNTGTWRFRGVFANAKRILTPGCFVRIRLPIGEPHQAMLVAELALGRDQGQKYLFVVNDQNKVEYRRIKVGRLYDGLREVTGGLKPGEKVIVNGLQRVREGATVEAEVKDMPVPNSDKEPRR